MTALLTDNLPLLAGAPNGIRKLRELVLELAVRGKLVPQDPNDEPATELLKRIGVERNKLSPKVKDQREVSVRAGTFELPETWCWANFGDVAQHNSGKTLDRGKNSGVARDYITTSNLYWGRFDLSNVRQMLIEEKDLARCTAIMNDLLICEGGEAGRAAVWDQGREICFQNHVHRARFLGGISPYYAQKYFERLNYCGEISKYRKGVGISNMSSKSLASIPMPLPPLAEQHRIVAKVDELMALCDRLEARQADADSAHAQLVQALLDSLTRARDAEDFAQGWQRLAEHFHTLFTSESSIDALKQTVLQLAVTGRLVPQDPKDAPASELIERIGEDKLRQDGGRRSAKVKCHSSSVELPSFECPPGWELVPFDDLIEPDCPIAYGVLVPGPDVPGGVPFARIADLDLVDPPHLPEKSISEEVDRQFERTRLRGGEILMGVVGSIGKLGLAPVSWAGANIARAICRIVPSQLISKRYIIWLLQSDFMRSQFLGDTRTLAQPTLNVGLIRSARAPLPPIAEQSRIVAKLDQIMAICDELKSRLSAARQLHGRLADALVEKAVT